MQRVAIIGAGPSGLVAAKSAIESGLEPVVFDRAPTYGGVWRLHDGLAWDTMHTNVSHYTCMFSDFPWTNPSEDFPSKQALYEYLGNYIAHFNLHNLLRFNNTVTRLENKDDHWHVSSLNKDGISQEEIFKYVIVSIGVFTTPRQPWIEGTSLFKGKLQHSYDYKKPDEFKDQRVIVVGGSFSGAEIASEVAKTAKEVVNVIRQPYWVVPRYIPNSLDLPEYTFPLDLVFYKRFSDESESTLAEVNRKKNTYFGKLCGDQDTVCDALRMDPESSIPLRVIVSDDYLPSIREKRIRIKKVAIEALTEKAMLFEDNTEERADSIIFATGYTLTLPFFNESTKEILEFSQEDLLQPLILHKGTFHPDLPNLAFVGMYRGPYFAGMELQARWACGVFSGQITPPTQMAMKQGLDEERAIRKKVPRPQLPRDYVAFSDSLAKEIGAFPDFKSLKENNMALYNILWPGPIIPACYRWCGPFSDPNYAFEQIIRAQHVLSTRKDSYSMKYGQFFTKPPVETVEKSMLPEESSDIRSSRK